MFDPIQFGRRASRALRAAAQRSRTVALLRCKYEAHLKGLSFQLDEPSQVVTLSDGHRDLKVNGSAIAPVWEGIKYFSELFWLVRAPRLDGRQVLDVSKSAEHVLARSGERYLFTAVPEAETTSELYVEFGQLREGCVAIDGGAYCGHSTCTMSRAVGASGRVFAFEPDRKNFAALRTNLAQHALPNVTALQEGLWSESGELDFATGLGMLGGIVPPDQAHASTQTSRIRVRSIPQLIADYQLTRVDLIKLDIEGAELEVLRSLGEVLRRFRPRVIVEAVTVNGRIETPDVVEFLRRHGYAFRILLEHWDADYQIVCGAPEAPTSLP